MWFAWKANGNSMKEEGAGGGGLKAKLLKVSKKLNLLGWGGDGYYLEEHN